MPRLTDPRTGVVLNVSDDTAERLVGMFDRADEEPTKKATSKKAPSGKFDSK